MIGCCPGSRLRTSRRLSLPLQNRADSRPRRWITRWIDEIVFPEGFEAALKMHLSGALPDAVACNDVQPSEGPELNSDAASSSGVQSNARNAWLGEEDSNPR